jgi:anti-anti-sigma factor
MIKIEQQPPYTIVEMPESIDLYNAAKLKKEIFPLVETTDFLAINFDKVNAIDSSGLGILAVLSKRMSAMNKFFGIYNINDNVYQIMKITAADKYFNVFETLDQLKKAN